LVASPFSAARTAAALLLETIIQVLKQKHNINPFKKTGFPIGFVQKLKKARIFLFSKAPFVRFR